MNTKQKGFTLIELLVVIAIIGLLSTMAVVSLNSARAKARDAKRLSDVKQMANVLSIVATEGTSATTLLGCIALNSNVTSCSNPGEILQFQKFIDPSANQTNCATGGTGCVMCVAGTAGSACTEGCQYSISPDGATVDTAKITFCLKNVAGNLSAGLHSIDANGSIN